MLLVAIKAYLTVFVCFGVNWLIAQCMCERPIVVGLVAGIVFGDIPTGVMIGASLEAIFLGAQVIGGAISAEPVNATVLAVCFSVVMGMDQGVAVSLAIPVGLVGGILYMLVFNVLMSIWAPVVDWAAGTGKVSAINFAHYFGWVLKYAILALPAFFAVLVGAEPVAALANQIPQNVLNGFTVCGQLLPATGMALLLKMIWDQKIAIFFLLGFVLVAYLKLPIMGVLAIGAVIVAVTAMRDKEIFDLKKRGTAAVAASAADQDEEEFFA
jgi:PTS system mannose-specific IIC component